MSAEQYTKAYADAWDRKDSFKFVGGKINQARKTWFVDTLGMMSSEEWDAKYGTPEG
jgi:hypothetical protein